MAKAGRKPKPASVHLLNGNPGKRNLEARFDKETDASKIRVKEVPLAPEWLDITARQEWERVAPLLMDIQVLTEADLSALEMYCKSYSRWKEAERQMDAARSTIMKTGKDGSYLQQLPQISISQKYQKICQSWMSEFGLTPSARARGLKTEDENNIDPSHEAFKGLL
jgi:P27 family predicted phage terminase small subunit